jgi:hypothetical protein
MEEAIEITRSFGLGGLGLLAAIFAFRLAMQTVTSLQAQRQQRNGNGSHRGNAAFERLVKELSLQCPLATGRRSLDDIYVVLVASDGKMLGVKDGLDAVANEVRDGNAKVIEAINTLRVETAKARRE